MLKTFEAKSEEKARFCDGHYWKMYAVSNGWLQMRVNQLRPLLRKRVQVFQYSKEVRLANRNKLAVKSAKNRFVESHVQNRASPLSGQVKAACRETDTLAR
jgi:DNA phosphorothioation-dependent restriction protein DptG